MSTDQNVNERSGCSRTVCCCSDAQSQAIVTRRDALSRTAMGFGSIALMDLLHREAAAADDVGSEQKQLHVFPVRVTLINNRKRGYEKEQSLH